jgi:predicted transcriptional regulator
MFFTDIEEEFAGLLVSLGIKKNTARVLVYLAHARDVTSRQLERGTDLRQPEVSLALKYLFERNWVESTQTNAPGKGRPFKIYNLSRPIEEIITDIESEKQQELHRKIELSEKLQNFIR